jgi:tetratricopeptide (TPR) repeat protein
MSDRDEWMSRERAVSSVDGVMGKGADFARKAVRSALRGLAPSGVRGRADEQRDRVTEAAMAAASDADGPIGTLESRPSPFGPTESPPLAELLARLAASQAGRVGEDLDHPIAATKVANIEDQTLTLAADGLERGQEARADRRLEAAEAHCLLALDWAYRGLPEDHWLIDGSLNGLALVYRDMRLDAEATACARKAIEVSQLRRDHEQTALGFNSLGSIHWTFGRRDQAVAAWQQGLVCARRSSATEDLRGILEAAIASALG